MAAELANLCHAGIFPQAQLVVRKAVAAQNLALVRVPLQGTDLESQVLLELVPSQSERSSHSRTAETSTCEWVSMELS